LGGTLERVFNRLDLRGTKKPLGELLPQLAIDAIAPRETVRALLDEVRLGGDKSVRELTIRFDGVDVPVAVVSAHMLEEAWNMIDESLREALIVAHDRILNFHLGEVHNEHTQDSGGVSISSVAQPVDRVGVYVPGGLAAYPSTVLMTVLPALAAGVQDVVLCTPPNGVGEASKVVLAAAYLCGVTEIFLAGGVQAIAAMTYGTESLKAVDVIAGPGNAWVAMAKQEVAGQVGIASAFAGPSEIAVIADHTCPPSSAAVDLVLQAEHGPGGRAWLITWDAAYADEVESATKEIVSLSPRSLETRATIETGGFVCLVDDPLQAIAVVNVLAPEHLQLMFEGARSFLGQIRHAGAVFIGNWAPASIGDYVAGPSHVLPTSGTARFSGALGVADFQKKMHIVEVSKDGFDELRGVVAELAVAEGLWAHGVSVSERERWANGGVSK